MNTTLKSLADALPFSYQWESPHDGGDVRIQDITDDSRQVRAGSLFVAYPGVAVDGHRFIGDAVRRGAAGIVCEYAPEGLSVPQIIVPNGRQAFAFLCAAWHGFPSRHMVMIGVTGTDGKTTTTNLIFSILRASGARVGMISTVNAVIGDRTLDTGLHTTTPDADEIQSYLTQMRDSGTTHCVLEVTSHGLAQYRVDAIDFDVVAVTNITHEHLDLHGSYDAYRAAKARLFEMVAASDDHVPATKAGIQITKAAVLNADDEFSYSYLRAIPVGRKIAYTRNPTQATPTSDTVSLAAVHHLPSGMALDVETPRGNVELRSGLIGDFNISNILAAVSVATALDVPMDAIRTGVAGFGGVPGRMERIDLGQPFTAIVDFAHTPNALDQCLRTLRSITPGRLIVVFGCAGERDVQKRPMMGHTAAQHADIVVLTAEDPRREDLETILDQIQAGIPVPPASKVEVVRRPDRRAAIQFACAEAQAGDTVVSCGKGHEQSMCFGTVETPWDDREAMRSAIEQRLRDGRK